MKVLQTSSVYHKSTEAICSFWSASLWVTTVNSRLLQEYFRFVHRSLVCFGYEELWWIIISRHTWLEQHRYACSVSSNSHLSQCMNELPFQLEELCSHSLTASLQWKSSWFTKTSKGINTDYTTLWCLLLPFPLNNAFL